MALADCGGSGHGNKYCLLQVPLLDAGTVSLLSVHDWPGNVRELGHALEAALIIGSDLGFEAASVMC